MSETPIGVPAKSQQHQFKPIPYITQALARLAIPQMVKLANSPEYAATKNTLVQKYGHVIVF